MVKFFVKKKKSKNTTKNKAKKTVKKKVVKKKIAKPKLKVKKMMLKRTVKAAKKVKSTKSKVKKMTAKKSIKKTKKTKQIKQDYNKMPDDKAYLILKRYRISLPEYEFCKDEKQLEAATKKVGFPCVMKVSGDILHKTDVNGVMQNINSIEEAKKAFNDLMKIKGCDSVLVQENVSSGYELIVGGKKDPQFNRVIALGAGGVFTEFLKDVSFRIVPLSRDDAEDMLNEVKFSELVLKGFRGNKPANKKAIIDTILAVSRIMEKYPKIKELDINPLFATPSKTIAADVRILVE
ncbi:MAG: acetate--CoA ligase family protein [Candidatus Aenigmarchaeota archaeon]|nr:acetate--CoA ligase family protein [Candidatus Aenigmarchaeota archaeon]